MTASILEFLFMPSKIAVSVEFFEIIYQENFLPFLGLSLALKPEVSHV